MSAFHNTFTPYIMSVGFSRGVLSAAEVQNAVLSEHCAFYPAGATDDDCACGSAEELIQTHYLDTGTCGAGAHVVVISRVASLPDIYAAVHVFTDEETAARGDGQPWALRVFDTREGADAFIQKGRA